MSRARLPAELTGPVEVLGIGLEGETLPALEPVRARGRVEGQEIPQLVLDQLASEIEPEVVLGEAQFLTVLLRHGRRGLQSVVGEESKEITLKIVAARAGHDVQHTSRAPP